MSQKMSHQSQWLSRHTTHEKMAGYVIFKSQMLHSYSPPTIYINKGGFVVWEISVSKWSLLELPLFTRKTKEGGGGAMNVANPTTEYLKLS